MFRTRVVSSYKTSLATRLRARLPRFARYESTQSSQASRIDRISARLPRPLRKYTDGLRNAPLSHVVAFLILHELTAIIPLIGLVALFHYTTLAPVNYMTEHFGAYVQSGVSRFEKYFKKKGWFGFEKEGRGNDKSAAPSDQHSTDEVLQKVASHDAKYKVLMDVALAYAITKALLPVRIIGSVWAAPWFARILIRTRKGITGK